MASVSVCVQDSDAWWKVKYPCCLYPRWSMVCFSFYFSPELRSPNAFFFGRLAWDDNISTVSLRITREDSRLVSFHARKSAFFIAGSRCVLLKLEDDSAMFVMFSRRRSILTLSFVLFVVLGCLVSFSNQCDKNSDCKNGYCTAGMCICNPGWWGSLCQFCRLR